MKKLITTRMLGVLFSAVVCSFAIAASASAASTVTRSFSTATPAASSSLGVTLTVGVTPPDSFYLIDEIVPTGWIVTSATNGGDFTTTPGHVFWTVLSGAVSIADQYTVTVPSSAAGINLFSGTYGFDVTPGGSILGATSVNVQAAAPILTTILVSANSTSVTVGSTLQFSATALDQNSVVMNPQPTFTWTSSSSTIASINAATGLATGVAAGGPITITATSGTASGTASLSVTPVAQILTSVVVTPAATSTVTGTTMQFTAIALDQSNLPMATQPAFVWSSTNPAVASIDPATGLATGVTAGGPVTIIATAGTIPGVAALTVTPAPVLTTINVAPVNPSVVAGTPQTFTAATLDQFGAAFAAAVVWTSSNPAVATIDPATGVAATLAAGTSVITATSGTVTGTTTLTVTAAPLVLTSIAVTPPTGALTVGGANLQLTASGLDQNLAPLAIQPTFTWVSDNPTVAMVDTTGLVMPMAAGTANITASSSGIVSNASVITVTVTPPTPALTTINVSPANPSVVAGTPQTFTAATLDQFGAAFAAAVVWTSSNPAVATIDPATGVAATLAAGTSVITATSGTVTGTTTLTVTVTPPVLVLTSITVTPTTLAMTVGGSTQQLTASALDQNGAALATQPSFIWTSNNTAVATVDTTGLVTPIASGTALITASSSGIVSNASAITVTVTPPVPVLTMLVISPTSTSIIVGHTQQFTAAGFDQLGAAFAATSTWSSSDTAVGTIDQATGLFSALAVGTTTITATSGTTTSTSFMTVVPAPILTSIQITPSNSSVTSGFSLQFTANTLDQNGSPIIATTTWASSNAAVGTIAANGLFTASTPGSSIITVTSGSLSATTTVTVQAPASSGGGGGGGGLPPTTIISAINVPLAVLPSQIGKLEQALDSGLKVTINVPENAVINKTLFSVIRGQLTDLTQTEKSDKLYPIESSIFNIVAADESGRAVTSFSKNITVTVSGVELPSDVVNLGVYFFNANSQEWVLMPGALFNADSKTFSFTTNHLTLFGIFRAPGLPSVVTPSQKIQKDKTEDQKQVLGVKIYEDGTLIRGGDKKIYVVISGEKERIVSMAELRQYAGKPVVSVSDSVIAGYPEHKFAKFRNGDLLRGPDKRIYVIKNNKKQLVKNLTELRKYRGKKINSADAPTIAHY